MLSDNGTQLVSAESSSELARMIEGWDDKKLKEYAADKRIKWIFIPPWFITPAQKIAIRHNLLTRYELYTVLLEVANQHR